MTHLISRRGFVQSAAAVALAGNLPRTAHAAAAAAPTSTPIRLGVASYTFRTLDTARLVASMKQLRLTDLNLKDVHLPMGSADEVKKHADELRAAGMKLTAAGTISFTKDDDADIRQKFEYVKAAGIPIIVGAPTRAVLPRVEKFVKEYDIKLAIHNHGPEDKEWPSPLDILAAVKNMDPRVGCCIDVGHTMRAGTDPIEAIRKVGPRLHDMHMKDLGNKTEKESQVAVGEGIMPIPEIFRTLEEIGYKGHVDLEYEIHGDNPMPGAIESFAYMRGVLSGMGQHAAV